MIGVGMLLLTAPWWATVVSMHGVGPFLAARATGGTIFSDVGASHEPALGFLSRIILGNTGEGRFPIIWILALLGVVWCVRERRALLPVWWATILLLDTRAGSTYSAAPVAMLAGLAAVHLLWPLVTERESEGVRAAPRPLVARTRCARDARLHRRGREHPVQLPERDRCAHGAPAGRARGDAVDGRAHGYVRACARAHQ